jgi:Double zinc ribbon
MTNPPAPRTTCPNCGASVSGRFCSECGAALKGGKCAQCDADLTPGAKFCHRCGAPVGAGTPADASRPAKRGKPAPAARDAQAPSPAASGLASFAPWAVAGFALVALVALVAYRGFSSAQPAAEQNGPVPLTGAAAVDLSSMTPQEMAQRLFNHIMRLNEEGKSDSVAFFAPMAMSAYAQLPEQDADTHYDLGRIYEVTHVYPSAMAQADTILAGSRTNLLGLALAMRVQRDMGNASESAAYGKRLRAAAPTERKKGLPGYEAHSADIDAALKEAAK